MGLQQVKEKELEIVKAETLTCSPGGTRVCASTHLMVRINVISFPSVVHDLKRQLQAGKFGVVLLYSDSVMSRCSRLKLKTRSRAIFESVLSVIADDLLAKRCCCTQMRRRSHSNDAKPYDTT